MLVRWESKSILTSHCLLLKAARQPTWPQSSRQIAHDGSLHHLLEEFSRTEKANLQSKVRFA
eukprot:1499168-Amphidinium_carterae.2